MDEELIEELDYEIDLLIKSGFFSEDEIFEIIEDEFESKHERNPISSISSRSL